MTTYVFDTEVLVAYLYDEPGADEVRNLLTTVEAEEATGVVSHATAAEFVYTVARLETGAPNETAPGETELEVATRDLRILRGFGLSVETPSHETVARLKAGGGLSLGDAYAGALAIEADATLVIGADPEFNSIASGLSLHRVRDDPA